MTESLIKGAFALYDTVQAWYGLALVLIVFVFIPLGLFDRTKRFAGKGLFQSSYLFGAGTWLLGAGMALALAGWFWLLVGLFFIGLGVVPVAIVAALIHGEAGIALALFIGLVITFGVRWLGAYLLGKADEIDRVMVI